MPYMEFKTLSGWVACYCFISAAGAVAGWATDTWQMGAALAAFGTAFGLFALGKWSAGRA